jgi:hypothetical protein
MKSPKDPNTLTIEELKERINSLEFVIKNFPNDQGIIPQMKEEIAMLTSIRNRKKQEEKTKHPIRSAIAHYATKGFRRGGNTRRRSGKNKNRKSFRKTRKH